MSTTKDAVQSYLYTHNDAALYAILQSVFVTFVRPKHINLTSLRTGLKIEDISDQSKPYEQSNTMEKHGMNQQNKTIISPQDTVNYRISKPVNNHDKKGFRCQYVLHFKKYKLSSLHSPSFF